MGKKVVDKEFIITMYAEEVEKVLSDYVKKTYGYDVEKVTFDINGDSDERGNYCGQTMDAVIFKGKL